jgi:hypothetical protein
LDGLECVAFVGVTAKRLPDFLHDTAFVSAWEIQVTISDCFTPVEVFPRLIRVFVNPREVVGRPVLFDERVGCVGRERV